MCYRQIVAYRWIVRLAQMVSSMVAISVVAPLLIRHHSALSSTVSQSTGKHLIACLDSAHLDLAHLDSAHLEECHL